MLSSVVTYYTLWACITSHPLEEMDILMRQPSKSLVVILTASKGVIHSGRPNGINQVPLKVEIPLSDSVQQ